MFCCQFVTLLIRLMFLVTYPTQVGFLARVQLCGEELVVVFEDSWAQTF